VRNLFGGKPPLPVDPALLLVRRPAIKAAREHGALAAWIGQINDSRVR